MLVWLALEPLCLATAPYPLWAAQPLAKVSWAALVWALVVARALALAAEEQVVVGLVAEGLELTLPESTQTPLVLLAAYGSLKTLLVNDESMPGYTLFNGTIGYHFEDFGYFKNPSVQLNVYNIFNQNYQRISSPSGSSFTSNAVALPGIAASAPAYYIGAPTFVSVTMRTDF